MAAGVLFDTPGPETIARHRIYTIVAASRSSRASPTPSSGWRTPVSSSTHKWEPFVTPRYIEAIL